MKSKFETAFDEMLGKLDTWINSTSALELAKAKSEAMIEIKAAFDKEGVEIPFPIRTLNIPQETLRELSGKS